MPVEQNYRQQGNSPDEQGRDPNQRTSQQNQDREQPQAKTSLQHKTCQGRNPQVWQQPPPHTSCQADNRQANHHLPHRLPDADRHLWVKRLVTGVINNKASSQPKQNQEAYPEGYPL